MISDILFEAITEIDRYRASDVTAKCYEGDLGARITELQDQMKGLQAYLDVPPPAIEAAGIDIASVPLADIPRILQESI